MFNLQHGLNGNPFWLVLKFYSNRNRLQKRLTSSKHFVRFGSGRRIKLPKLI
mgnify:CR=1 FL=1